MSLSLSLSLVDERRTPLFSKTSGKRTGSPVRRLSWSSHQISILLLFLSFFSFFFKQRETCLPGMSLRGGREDISRFLLPLLKGKTRVWFPTSFQPVEIPLICSSSQLVARLDGPLILITML